MENVRTYRAESRAQCCSRHSLGSLQSRAHPRWRRQTYRYFYCAHGGWHLGHQRRTSAPPSRALAQWPECACADELHRAWVWWPRANWILPFYVVRLTEFERARRRVARVCIEVYRLISVHPTDRLYYEDRGLGARVRELTALAHCGSAL
ncbi:hypothetical protein BC828DRAFT_106946 [Blastocladiella britannica]|nr:hypothetical protein BC828DRAFT_106946 [Blastocladiella britannica]